ncbi:MAG: hypothetical protein RLZZ28_1057 [Bacteroidota bacterium]|jgi:(S)-ureidoglycine aminohydrolase
MKIIITVIALFFYTAGSAQLQTLNADVYHWANGTSKREIRTKIFEGSGAVLDIHAMNAIGLEKGKNLRLKADSADNEHFYIVKKGPVKVVLNNRSYTLDRGSVVFVLPGDPVMISNAGETQAQLYEMIFRSKNGVNLQRGYASGPSFVMNWNNMTEKQTEKGSTRQLFDRKTAMLNRFDIHVTKLNVGLSSHPPHTHANEEIILMLEGDSEETIGTSTKQSAAGDAIYLSTMIPHNLTNIGKIPCLYFAIQWN